MKNSKLVSVIIPTFNCGKFISEGIESVLKQSYGNFEILVIDDGSVDNTKDILEAFINSGSIKYCEQKHKGPAAARNVGILRSKGEYIAFLDADDLWERDKLTRSIKFMESNNFHWICTAMSRFTEKGETVLKRIPKDCWAVDSKTGEIKQLKNGIFFFSDIFVHTPTIVVKKECLDNVGVFDESFLVGEDTDLWLRLEEAGFRGGYLDNPLTIYRYNEKSITKGKKIDGLKEHSKVAKKHALILGMKNSMIRKSFSEFLWQVADRYYSQKRYFHAFKNIFFSIYYDKSKLKKCLVKVCKLNQ